MYSYKESGPVVTKVLPSACVSRVGEGENGDREEDRGQKETRSERETGVGQSYHDGRECVLYILRR